MAYFKIAQAFQINTRARFVEQRGWLAGWFMKFTCAFCGAEIESIDAREARVELA